MGLLEKARALLQLHEQEKHSNDVKKELLYHHQELLLNLLELQRQLVEASTEQKFWQFFLNSVRAQTGCQQSAIFYLEQDHIILRHSYGYAFDTDFRFAFDSPFIKFLQQQQGIVSLTDVVAQLGGRELVWLKALQPDLILPLYNFDKLSGILFLSKNNAVQNSSLQFSSEEKIYVQLVAEIFAYFYDNIKKIIYVEEQKKIWQQQQSLQDAYNRFIADLEICKNVQQAIEVIADFLKNNIKNGKYALLTTTKKQLFTPLLSHGLLPETTQRLQFFENQKWIEESQVYSGWSKYNKFHEDKDLQAALENEPFLKQESHSNYQMHSLPIYHYGQLKAIFVLFKTEQVLKTEQLHHLQAALNNFMWFRFGMMFYEDNDSFEEILQQTLSNPLRTIRSAYQRFEWKFKNERRNYGIITIRFSNLERLKLLVGEKHAEKIIYDLKDLITNKQSNNDILSAISPHLYLLLLDNYSEADCYHLAVKIEELFKSYEEKQRPILQIKSFARANTAYVSFEELF